MPGGTPLKRQWIFVTPDGIVAYDWGDGQAQDLVTGEFFPAPPQHTYLTADDAVLQQLVRMGVAETFDDDYLYVRTLPERPQRTLD